MKAKRLFSIIQENWPAKVICFVMALCFYMFYQVSSLDSRTFVVPLHVKAENGMVPAEPYPSDVKVTVRCKKEDAALLHESDFYAYLNTDYAVDDGSYSFHVYTTLTGNALTVSPLEIRLSPEEVPLAVEQQVSGYVPIKPLISGSPAYGYELKEATVLPAQAKMTGPHRLVENYRRLQTKTVSVEGLSDSATLETTLEPVGGFLKVTGPETVSVQVTIEPVMIERTYDSLKINLINVPSAYEASLPVETLSLSLSGSQAQLEKYTPNGFVFFANCAAVTEAGLADVPLTVMVPESFTLAADTPKTVQVRFTERKSAAETGPAASSDDAGENSAADRETGE